MHVSDIDHSSVVGAAVVCQFGGAAARWNRRTVCTKNFSSSANIEAGSLSASASLPAGRHAENNGQRRNVLCASRAFHFYFQVLNSSHLKSMFSYPTLFVDVRVFDILKECAVLDLRFIANFRQFSCHVLISRVKYNTACHNSQPINIYQCRYNFAFIILMSHCDADVGVDFLLSPSCGNNSSAGCF